MSNFPFFIKLVLNFVAYVLYTIFFSVVFSFIFPIVLAIFGKEPLDPSNPIFSKIQIILAIIIFIVTIIYRKYFYISMSKNIFDTEVSQTKKYETKAKKSIVDNFLDDDDIKIYVDKEIKR